MSVGARKRETIRKMCIRDSVYATGDETPEDYRSLITSVLQSEHGASVDPSKVEISGKIDHEHPGSYDVLFSYTNDAGLESSVILTVVVE